MLGSASQSQWFLLHFCLPPHRYNLGSLGRRKTFTGTSSGRLMVSLKPQFLFFFPRPPALASYSFAPLCTYCAKAGTSPSVLMLLCACRQLAQRLCLPGKVWDLSSVAEGVCQAWLCWLTSARSVSLPGECAWDEWPRNSYPEPRVLWLLLRCDKQHPHTSCLISSLQA